MEVFLTALILVPTFAVLVLGAAYIIGTFTMSIVAAIDAIVLTFEHKADTLGGLRGGTGYGAPALHH